MSVRPVPSFAAAAASASSQGLSASHANALDSGSAAASAFGNATATGVPRAIIPTMEEIGVGSGVGSDGGFDLTSDALRPVEQRFEFPAGLESSVESGIASAAVAAAQALGASSWAGNLVAPNASAPATLPRPDQIADLKPLGQVSSSFIVAVNGEGSVACRSACCPRASALRAAPRRAARGKSGSAAHAHADGDRAFAATDRDLRKNCGGT